MYGRGVKGIAGQLRAEQDVTMKVVSGNFCLPTSNFIIKMAEANLGFLENGTSNPLLLTGTRSAFIIKLLMIGG